jgi:hypothetical protein
LTRTTLSTAAVALAALILLGGTGVPAEEDQQHQTIAEPADRSPAPLIEVARPEHHAGTVSRGEEVSTVFTVRNSGTADLRLVKADGHCSCISTTILQPVIPSGEEGDVEVTFVGHNAVGETRRVIELTSNDPHNRLTRLIFSAKVEVPWGFETRALAMGKIHHQTADPVSRSATILVRDAAHTELAGLDSTSPKITARLVGASEAREDHQRLEIEVTALPGLPPGPLNETITATAASGDLPPATLTITGLVTGDVEVTPDHLRLMVVETRKREARDSWKRIYLSGHCPERPLRVFDCRDSNEILDFDLVELISGEKFELTVTLGADDLEANNELEGTISISTNSPSQAVVTVGYSAVHRLYDKLDQGGDEKPPGDQDHAGKIPDTVDSGAGKAAEDG